MRKEVALVRKRIDSVNKELKPLGHTCQKKVRLIEIHSLKLYPGYVILSETPFKLSFLIRYRRKNTKKPLKLLMIRTGKKYS